MQSGNIGEERKDECNLGYCRASSLILEMLLGTDLKQTDVLFLAFGTTTKAGQLTESIADEICSSSLQRKITVRLARKPLAEPCSTVNTIGHRPVPQSLMSVFGFHIGHT